MPLKIFVADDSDTIQKVIGLAFADTDAAVEFTKRGDGLLDAVRAFDPDIVLADICLPDLNGYEICARMKESPELAHIPVVLLVGTFEPFEEAEASRVGAAASLTKPFDTSELLDIVRKEVGRNIMPPENESEAAFDSAGSDFNSLSAPNDRITNAKIPISRQAWDSFLGNERVLDVFNAAAMADADRKLGSQSILSGVATTPNTPTAGSAAITVDQLSDEALDRILKKVVEKMSTDIISEIAWEVVPELSEILIRRAIEEGKKPE
jgi:CheY-like chemotaxis protein